MGIESFIRSMCVQDAVYWGNPTQDGFGNKTYDDPEEIKVRWDEKPQLIAGKDGREITTDVEILTPEDLDVGGMLYLGNLDDIGSDDNPHAIENTYEIMGRTKISMPKSVTEFVRIVYLKRDSR